MEPTVDQVCAQDSIDVPDVMPPIPIDHGEVDAHGNRE